MSAAGNGGNFADDLRAAKERDLGPLLEECVEELDLGFQQTIDIERFLDEAWFFGSRNGHAQMRARAAARDFQIPPVRVDELEVEFRVLMEAAAEVLNLDVNNTMTMWGLLGRAWSLGTNSCETELMALLLPRITDVAGEAQEWLEELDEEPEEEEE